MIYKTTNDFNTFLVAIFDEKLEQAQLATNSDLITIKQHSIKNE